MCPRSSAASSSFFSAGARRGRRSSPCFAANGLKRLASPCLPFGMKEDSRGVLLPDLVKGLNGTKDDNRGVPSPKSLLGTKCANRGVGSRERLRLAACSVGTNCDMLAVELAVPGRLRRLGQPPPSVGTRCDKRGVSSDAPPLGANCEQRGVHASEAPSSSAVRLIASLSKLQKSEFVIPKYKGGNGGPSNREVLNNDVSCPGDKGGK